MPKMSFNRFINLEANPKEAAQIEFVSFRNSLSLLGDGALMAMDGVSYAVSLYAEKRKSSAADAERLDRMARSSDIT